MTLINAFELVINRIPVSNVFCSHKLHLKQMKNSKRCLLKQFICLEVDWIEYKINEVNSVLWASIRIEKV
jgi:hypothetical protein